MNYSTPGKQVGRLSLRNDRTLFLFVFADERGEVIDSFDTESQRKALRAQFGNLGWECPQILAAMESCPELYFDRVSQIRMDTWSKGRVGLIGDAAFCPSLLAGQGSALAMIAAYVLAGELGRTPNSPEAALTRYEELLHPFMLAKQQAAEKLATSFTPKTRWGLFLRNQITRAFAIPFVAKFAMGASLLDRIDLPDYSEENIRDVSRITAVARVVCNKFLSLARLDKSTARGEKKPIRRGTRCEILMRQVYRSPLSWLTNNQTTQMKKRPSTKDIPTALNHECCSTGVAGLDEILAGGFPRSSFFLIQGDPGSG